MAGTTPQTAGAAGAGGGLWRGRPVRLLLVVDAALLVMLLVVALLTRGAGGQEPAATPEAGTTASTGTAGGPASTPAGSATTPGSSPSSTGSPDRFVTPSGNIACVLTAGSATCAIRSPTFTEPALEGCAQAGRAVIVDTTGVQVLCPDVLADDPFGGDPAELAYGSTTTVGTYTCTSATNGVTCVDSSGVGFRLARASLTMLP